MFLECVLQFLCAWPGAEINISTWNKLEIGMTQDQLSRFLGYPPGDYRLFPEPMDDDNPLFSRFRSLDYTHCWIGDFGKIGVRFDNQGRLEGKRFTYVGPAKKMPLLKLLQYHLIEGLSYFDNSNVGRGSGASPLRKNISDISDYVDGKSTRAW
jgi:hypothetical protein